MRYLSQGRYERAGRDGQNVAALKPYVKWVHPAFDAGNFPYAVDRAKPTPSDMVAIGTGAHVFVIGPAANPSTVDLSRIDLSLTRNNETIRKSPARDVLGNPWNSLLWCVNHLHKYGLSLEPGMVVVFEPTMRVMGVGSINIEDTVLITENGNEPLARSVRELVPCGIATD